MRRILSLVAATLLAGSAAAQMNTGAAGTTDASMTVVEIDRAGSRMLVRDIAGRQQTLRLDDATRFERQGVAGAPGRTMRLDDLTVGDRILVTNPAQTGGAVSRIQVLPPGAVGAPGTERPGAASPGQRPASPGTGVNRPGVSNPAAPPGGSGGAGSGSGSGGSGGAGGGGGGS